MLPYFLTVAPVYQKNEKSIFMSSYSKDNIFNSFPEMFIHFRNVFVAHGLIELLWVRVFFPPKRLSVIMCFLQYFWSKSQAVSHLLVSLNPQYLLYQRIQTSKPTPLGPISCLHTRNYLLEQCWYKSNKGALRDNGDDVAHCSLHSYLLHEIFSIFVLDKVYILFSVVGCTGLSSELHD